MASFRPRAAAVALVCAVLSVVPVSPAHAATTLRLVVTDEAWQRFASRYPGAVGLGVYPDSRDSLRFLEEIGNGAPLARPGVRSPVRGKRGALADALTRGHVGIAVRAADGGRFGTILRRAFPADVTPARGGPALEVVSYLGVAVGPLPDGPAIVLGLGDRTPVWVEICEMLCGRTSTRVITGGIARRPGIVTPYDIAATILDHFGITRSETFIGNPLHSERDPNALERVRRLARDLDRSSGLGATMGATATVMAIAALALGLLLRVAGRRDLSARTGQIAAFASTGYLVALFLPTSSGTVRALVIALAAVVLVAVSGREPSATARILLGAAALFAVLVVVAPLRPGGLPGSAIWGNPLISWRFFGVQNFEVSVLASAVVVWGVVVGLRARQFAAIAVAATIVIGAPTVGANFVGVLTMAFGASLAILALVRKRVELWQAFVSAAIASAAFAVSLLADAASPVSHGGRAARRIGEGGFSTLVDFVESRLRLNIDLIRGFKGGIVFTAMLLATIAALMVFGTKPRRPRRARMAVWAGAAMALSSVVLEDSGFYSGAIMLAAAAAGWMVATATDEPDDLSSPASGRALAGGG